MASTLVIGDKNYSSWSMRPWLVLHVFGIKFTEKPIPSDGFSESSHFKQSVAKYSPAGRVPFCKV
ncbi:MAG: glutathione S-transferase N-terminal domain-containing protein [Rhodobacteraceae bacterium]|nr:glutathione S-transferase N-terminal domain-containing protein [Paracoccaceae bacterium]MBL6641222.1 glutathione S-transferase N-terminal domain-containing protein [Paracoccaceae bacterium]MBL6790165.1 glutathione S-transferase N-terminal domain-containing protein [Paracoccaceae bacterium]